MDAHPPMSTGIDELDRVLGGGLLPGSATLLGGEPGTGKSTLLLQVMAAMASAGRRCLLVAAEEAAHQVRRRAARLGADIPGVFVVEATQLSAVEEAVVSLRPDMVVVDSIQALGDAEIGSPAGSLAQVRSCAQALVTLAKASGTALVLVGHVTKEGVLAGPARPRTSGGHRPQLRGGPLPVPTGAAGSEAPLRPDRRDGAFRNGGRGPYSGG